MSERDLFANFERMRREMDELFGDVFDRGLAPRRRGGFIPAVDVYYAGDPPRAVVRADLAGIDPAAGRARDPRPRADPRRPARVPPAAGRGARSTSSSRSSTARSAAWSRSAPTSTPTRAGRTYEDGMLVVELPIAGARRPARVPIEPRRREPSEAA